MLAIDIFLVSLAGYLCMQDFRHRKVALVPALLFLVCGFYFYGEMGAERLYVAGGIFCSLLIPLHKKWIASLDVLFLGITPLFIPVDHLPFFLITVGGVIIIYAVIFLHAPTFLGEKGWFPWVNTLSYKTIVPLSESHIPFLSIYLPIFFIWLWCMKIFF